MSADTNGIVRVTSNHPFAETLERLESSVLSKGLTVFARIDFSGDASKAGLAMRPTRMLVFGNPKAGTPLMVASPTVAIDLPLKVVVSEDDGGVVSILYDSPEYLMMRHGIPEALLKNIAGIAPLVDAVAN
jgi:uncharacterized protein (DUF302 family)